LRFHAGSNPPSVEIGQRLALEKLHHEKTDARRLADVVQRADVRMAQRGNDARLALEALAELRIVGGVRRQNLDCDPPIEPRVARLVHLAHAAGADRRQNLVRAEASSRGNRHVREARL